MRGLLALLLAIGSFSSAFGQTCSVVTNYFWDCTSCPGGRELSPTGRSYRINRWAFGGKQYLIFSNYTSANFYDVTNPENPILALEGAAYTPWGISEGSPDDDTQQWDLALLPDSPTGLGMFMNFGWVTFNVTTTAQGALSGFQTLQRYRITPPNYIPTSRGAKNAALFVAANGKTYAAAAYLAQGQSTGAIDIADMSNPNSLQVVATLSNTSATGLIRVMGSGSQAYLITQDLYGNKILIFNVGNPASAGQVAEIAAPGLKDFEVWQNRLYLVYKPSSTVAAAVYDLSNPASPQQLFSVTGLSWQYNNVTGIGDYIIVSSSANETSDLPVRAYDITHPTTPATFPIEPPNGSWFQETELDSAVLDAGSKLVFYRAAWGRLSRTSIPKSCFSTDPQPAFTVSGGSSTACAGTPTGGSQGVAGKGFPGDSFTIQDSSGGVIASRQLEIRRAADNQVVQQWGPVTSWSGPLTWNPATNEQPGEYWVTLTLTGTDNQVYTLKKSIWLCATPQAALTRNPNQPSYLLNTNLTLDATGSQGHPTGYDFYLWLPGSNTPQVIPASSATTQVSLANCGTYKAALVVHYAHAGADSCNESWYTDANPASYDACVPPASFAVAGAAVSFVAKQNGQETVAPLVAQPFTLEATVQGATATAYQWSSSPTVAVIDSCTTATCTVPANTLTAGTTYTITLTVQVTGVPTGCEPQPASHQLTPTTASAGFTVSPTNPAIGQNVTLTLQNVTGSFQSMKYEFAGSLTCSGQAFQALVCGAPFYECASGKSTQVAFASAGAVSITLKGVPTGSSSEIPLATQSITVGSSGSCGGGGGGGNGTLSITVNPTNPAPGQNLSITWSFSPPASGDGALTVLFGDGSAPKVVEWPPSAFAYPVAYNYANAGTYTIQVSGTVGGVSYSGSKTIVVGSGGGGGGGGGGGQTLTLTANPSSGLTIPGTVQFTFAPALTGTADRLTFNFGDGQTQLLQIEPPITRMDRVSHTYTTYPASGSAFTVTASGTIGGQSYSGQVTVTVACDKTSAPTANFTWTPSQPRAGQPVQFTDTSTGGPTTWSWQVRQDILQIASSAQQNPTFTFPAAGSYTVKLTAANCKGSSTKEVTIQVADACGATAPPTVSDIAKEEVSPTHGRVCIVFPDQCSKQPYVGQSVRLSVSLAAGSPEATAWEWYWSGSQSADSTAGQPVTSWNSPGDKTVRVVAKNCAGSSQAFTKTITVYPDERPVTADFQWTGTPAVGQSTSFTAKTGFEYGDPTSFTWTIEDPKPGEPSPVQLSGNPIAYSFKCGGSRRVTLTAKRGSFPGSVTKTVSVEGPLCGPQGFVAADAAKVEGLNGTFWRTDLRIFNPAEEVTQVSLDILVPGQSNSNPPGISNVPVAPKGTLALDNVLEFFRQQIGLDAAKAAIRVRFANQSGVAPVVVGRTYTDVPGGGTYGQFIPGLEVRPGSSPQEQWLTGLSQAASLSEGFRTNVSLYNLRQDRDSQVTLYLYDGAGQLVASKAKSIAPLGYEQASLKDFFGITPPLAVGALKLLLGPNSDVGVNASVVDNRTGDASLGSNEPVPNADVLLIPGIARLAGEAGTNWRSSLYITNPTNSAKTFQITLVKKDGTIKGRLLSLQGNESRAMEDVVAWIYGDDPVPASVSGVLKIAADGGTLPVVTARTFNLTQGGGTYGQNLKAFHAGNSAGGGTPYRKLYLAGISTEDIARSNLGFVHVGGGTVNFKIWFYDEAGNLLNPDGQPYTFALSAANPWDQDKLENRFRNKGWTPPVNKRAIGAVIQVEGAMGQAYVSVVDQHTGDPIFIPATPAP